MKHILINDDDIHINEMLDKVLKQEGYQGVPCVYRYGSAAPVVDLPAGFDSVGSYAAWFIRGRKCSHRSPGYRSSL